MYTLPTSAASSPIPARPLQTTEGTHSPPAEPTVGSDGTKWSLPDQKKFEKLLADFLDDMPGRWEKMASELGRAASELEENYQALLRDIVLIESEVETALGDSVPHHTEPKRQRKKAVPWTTEEHKLFLHGLKVYGKGDWRSIARKVVRTRTPMQVASHAQKYNERVKFNEKLKLDETKKKKRKSIHDLDVEELEQVTPEKKELEQVTYEKKEVEQVAQVTFEKKGLEQLTPEKKELEQVAAEKSEHRHIAKIEQTH